MIHHRNFEKTIMGFIMANILVMAMQHRLVASLTGLVQLSDLQWGSVLTCP